MLDTDTPTRPAPTVIPDHDAAGAAPITRRPDRELDAFCEHTAEEAAFTHGPCQWCDHPDYVAYLRYCDQLAEGADNVCPDWDTRCIEGPDIARVPGWWLAPGTPQWAYV